MHTKSAHAQRPTRRIHVGTTRIGGNAPIAVQSMCATKTTDEAATLAQIRLLERAGADLIRVAVDSKKEVEALRRIREQTQANLVVDLQENYRLAAEVAPFVQKFRYNPGHLHHHQREVSVEDKVKFFVEVAQAHDCAMRVGVNFGSIDPSQKAQEESSYDAALASAQEHCEMLEALGFERYVVSLKSSDPNAVIEINRQFAERMPHVPLHLGVTEAGMPPEGVRKTRIAFEQLLAAGIGDTVRVSLTLPDDQKDQEVTAAKQILSDVEAGRFVAPPRYEQEGLNIISCPSCSRVENAAFVDLAQQVKDLTTYLETHPATQARPLTIAVMGCRVNGPGETDDADIGLWCAPRFVNVKRGPELVGQYRYDQVLGIVQNMIDEWLAEKDFAA